MSYRKTTFDDFNSNFAELASDFLNENSPTAEKLTEIIDAYNAIITYSDVRYEHKHESTKDYIVENVTANRSTLQSCYEKLNIPISLPGRLLSTIHFVPPPQPDNSNQNPNNSDSNSNNDSNNSNSNNNLNTDNSNSDNPNPNPNNSNQDIMPDTEPKMSTQTVESFLKSASSIINYKFSGDPLKLNSFINDTILVQALAENETTKAFCLNFLKSRLEGKADECIPDECDSIEK